MALILSPGESLQVGDVRTDESHRHRLVLQQDGNLVVYAYVAEPVMKCRAVGATMTSHGPNIYFRLNVDGCVEILDKGTNVEKWFEPRRGIRHIVRDGTPNSTLHLQEDGNLVLYRPDRTPAWSTGTNLGDDVVNCVPPNTLVIKIDVAISAGPGDKTIVNNTGGEIGVRAPQRYIFLPPGGSVGVVTPGTIIISATSYDFSDPNHAKTENAVPAKSYGPGQNTISVIKGAGGFGLA